MHPKFMTLLLLYTIEASITSPTYGPSSHSIAGSFHLHLRILFCFILSSFVVFLLYNGVTMFMFKKRKMGKMTFPFLLVFD